MREPLLALSPIDQAQNVAPRPVFTWNAHPDATRYRLILRRHGNILYNGRFKAHEICLDGVCRIDTATIPDFPRLRPERRYVWFVVALTPDTQLRGPRQRIQIAPRLICPESGCIGTATPFRTNTPRPTNTPIPPTQCIASGESPENCGPGFWTQTPTRTHTRTPSRTPTRTLTRTPSPTASLTPSRTPIPPTQCIAGVDHAPDVCGPGFWTATFTPTRTPTPRGEVIPKPTSPTCEMVTGSNCDQPTPTEDGRYCMYGAGDYVVCTPSPTARPLMTLTPSLTPSRTPSNTPNPEATLIPCSMRDRNGVNVLAATANAETDGGSYLANDDVVVAALMLIQVNTFRGTGNWIALGTFGSTPPENLPTNPNIPRMNDIASIMVESFCTTGEPLTLFGDDVYPRIANDPTLAQIAADISVRFEVSIHATRSDQFRADDEYSVKYVFNAPNAIKAVVIGDVSITNAWLRYQCPLEDPNRTSGPKYELMRGNPTHIERPFTDPDSNGAKFSCEPGKEEDSCARLTHYWVDIGRNVFEMWTAEKMFNEEESGYGAQCG